MKKISLILLGVLILFSITGINQSQATLLDLGAVTSGTINGANFARFDESKAGRGVYPTFLATQGDAGNAPGVNKGYNSDYRPVEFNETTSDIHNHSVLLSDIGQVSYGGQSYYSFALDADQAPGSSPLLDLVELEIYQTNNPAITNYAGFGAPIWDLDGGLVDGDSTVQVDYLQSGKGSGWADMVVDIPANLFDDDFSNVVLFAQFTGDNDGPQEWRHLADGTPPVPEPATMLLLGSGLVGLVGLKRRFKK